MTLIGLAEVGVAAREAEELIVPGAAVDHVGPVLEPADRVVARGSRREERRGLNVILGPERTVCEGHLLEAVTVAERELPVDEDRARRGSRDLQGDVVEVRRGTDRGDSRDGDAGA